MISRSWTAPARPESVGALRREATDLLLAEGVARPAVDDVRLALSEALANAVVHAYRDAAGPGELRLEIRVEPGLARLTVSDDGRGLSPRDDSPGLGLGMPLIEHLAHEVVYAAPPGGGTEVRMRFRLDR